MSDPSPGSTVLARLEALVPDAVERVAREDGELRVYVKPGRLKRMMGRLLNDEILGPAVLSDLAALPHAGGRGRMEVLYSLAWPEWRQRLVVRVALRGPAPRLDSVAGIWPCADWLEREVWDLCGIVFEGHPDLRRILLPEAFEGHPLAGDDPPTLEGPPAQEPGG
jgi:NADH-quinone oxidoreductase subunit C